MGESCMYARLILGTWVAAPWYFGVLGMNVSGCKCIRDCVCVGVVCLGL